MPRGDGTGPLGQGSVTGWGRGGCVPNGSRQRAFGGYARGGGFGFSRTMPLNGFGQNNEPTKQELKEELGYLEGMLETIGAQVNKIRERTKED